MSLANVSNISVISLPIAATELTNAQHYASSPTAEQAPSHLSTRYPEPQALDQFRPSEIGVAVRGPRIPYHGGRFAQRYRPEKEIVILGEQIFQFCSPANRLTSGECDVPTSIMKR